jgi:hypothetical protein
MMSRRAKRKKSIENQVDRLGHRLTKLQALSRRLSLYRLIIFILGGALVFISFFWINENLAWFFAGSAFITFIIIAYYHHRLEKGIRRHQIWMDIKKFQLARMNLDWEKIPVSMLQLPFSDLSFENDLELVKLVDEVPGNTNCHFREKVVDGKMVFDYKLRPRPCPTTNALEIMRIEGLPIE